MEKCEGGELFDKIIELDSINETDSCIIMHQIARGVKYMHSVGIIHRDLKPENIIFSKSDPNCPKIIDFGDAEMATPGKTYTEFVGTPFYMSPERLAEHNSEELKKSDIWAIGAIVYEMFSGNTCFNGTTQKEIFAKVLNGQWEWNMNRQPSTDMQEFVQGCLDMNVKKRFSVEAAMKHRWFADINDMEESESKRTIQQIPNVSPVLSDSEFIMA
eukprot:540039_1